MSYLCLREALPQILLLLNLPQPRVLRLLRHYSHVLTALCDVTRHLLFLLKVLIALLLRIPILLGCRITAEDQALLDVLRVLLLIEVLSMM
jgi:hypothetical protein